MGLYKRCVRSAHWTQSSVWSTLGMQSTPLSCRPHTAARGFRPHGRLREQHAPRKASPVSSTPPGARYVQPEACKPAPATPCGTAPPDLPGQAMRGAGAQDAALGAAEAGASAGERGRGWRAQRALRGRRRVHAGHARRARVAGRRGRERDAVQAAGRIQGHQRVAAALVGPGGERGAQRRGERQPQRGAARRALGQRQHARLLRQRGTGSSGAALQQPAARANAVCALAARSGARWARGSRERRARRGLGSKQRDPVLLPGSNAQAGRPCRAVQVLCMSACGLC